jgi:hypothetical protein
MKFCMKNVLLERILRRTESEDRVVASEWETSYVCLRWKLAGSRPAPRRIREYVPQLQRSVWGTGPASGNSSSGMIWETHWLTGKVAAAAFITIANLLDRDRRPSNSTEMFHLYIFASL